MPNPGTIYGTHHLTFCVGGAQEDYDFHVRLLGLKSVKKTVLFDGVRHDLVAQWDEGDAVIAESQVTYTRKDRQRVTIPVVTIYRSTGDLIDDYRVFIDLAPVFA